MKQFFVVRDAWGRRSLKSLLQTIYSWFLLELSEQRASYQGLGQFIKSVAISEKSAPLVCNIQ